MREDMMITYQQVKASKQTITSLRRIHYEYVSKYRRIIVVSDGGGFLIEVSYRGLPDKINGFTKRYGDLAIALSWAKVISDNREIRCGILTIKEAVGKKLV